MAPSPVPILIVIVITNAFVGLLVGDEIVERRFSAIDDPTETDDCGFFCIEAVEIVASIIQSVWAVILIIFDFLSFNIPTTPPPPVWIRSIVGLPMSGGLIWSIVTLIRGT